MPPSKKKKTTKTKTKTQKKEEVEEEQENQKEDLKHVKNFIKSLKIYQHIEIPHLFPPSSPSQTAREDEKDETILWFGSQVNFQEFVSLIEKTVKYAQESRQRVKRLQEEKSNIPAFLGLPNKFALTCFVHAIFQIIVNNDEMVEGFLHAFDGMNQEKFSKLNIKEGTKNLIQASRMYYILICMITYWDAQLYQFVPTKDKHKYRHATFNTLCKIGPILLFLFKKQVLNTQPEPNLQEKRKNVSKSLKLEDFVMCSPTYKKLMEIDLHEGDIDSLFSGVYDDEFRQKDAHELFETISELVDIPSSTFENVFRYNDKAEQGDSYFIWEEIYKLFESPIFQQPSFFLNKPVVTYPLDVKETETETTNISDTLSTQDHLFVLDLSTASEEEEKSKAELKVIQAFVDPSEIEHVNFVQVPRGSFQIVKKHPSQFKAFTRSNLLFVSADRMKNVSVKEHLHFYSDTFQLIEASIFKDLTRKSDEEQQGHFFNFILDKRTNTWFKVDDGHPISPLSKFQPKLFSKGFLVYEKTN